MCATTLTWAGVILKKIMCVGVLIDVHGVPCGGQKRASDPLELELQADLS